MFESNVITSSEELRKFNLLKDRFLNVKMAVNSSLKNAGKINPFTGESLSDTQIAELRRKQMIINSIEPLLVPEYSKLKEFVYYFNNGHFRSEDEIKAYKEMKIEKEWSVCDKFNKHVGIQLGLFGVLLVFMLLLPCLLFGRIAIYLYLFPVWPAFVLGAFYCIYKFAKGHIFKDSKKRRNHSNSYEMTKEYISGTTMSFIQKFY